MVLLVTFAPSIFAQTENLAQPGAGGDSIALTIAFFVVGSLILAGGVTLWVRVLSRPQPLLEQDGKPSAIGFVDLVLVFILWMGTQIMAGALMVVAGVELGANNPSSLVPLMVISGAAQLLATLIAAALLCIRYRSPTSFGLRFDRIGVDLRLGIAAFLMVVPGVLLLQWVLSLLVPYDHPTLTSLLENPSSSTVAACWFAAVFSAPIAEEFFFRGILQNWLQRLNRNSLQRNQVLFGGWDHASSELLNGDTNGPNLNVPPIVPVRADDNPYQSPAPMLVGNPADAVASTVPPVWPIYVSSAVFAVAHLGQGLAPIALFFFSLAIGYLYRQTSSLIPCILLHFLLNGFSMFWFTLNVLL